MPVLNNVFPVPTGGVIGLSFSTATCGTVTLTRSISGSGGLSSTATIYSGAPLSLTGESCFFLDIGDGSPGPLLPGTLYVYQLTDIVGTVTSPPIITASNVNISQTQYTQICIAVLQGAINAAQAGNSLPPGIKWAKVMAAMPIAGQPPLPAIFVNPELVQQEAVPLGQDNENPGDLIQPGHTNIWTQTEQDRRMFRITVLSLSPEERDYYSDFIIAMLRVSVAYAFSQFGADTIHSYQATSYQEVDQTNLMVPGFYAADIMYEFVATSNVQITTNYNLIETIVATVSGSYDTSISTISLATGAQTVAGSGIPVQIIAQVPTL